MKKTFRITALILSLVLLAACAPAAEIKVDDEGDYVLTSAMGEETQAEIKVITDAFSAALSEKSGAKIMEYLDANFAVQEEELTAFFRDAAARDKKPYEIFDTYYVNGIKDSDVSIRIKKSQSDTDYAMLTPGSSEICATLFLSKNEDMSQIITLLTARVDGDMKIVWIDTSDYDYYGKTAPEYYELSKKAKEDGDEYLAYVYAQMMLNICQPGNVLYYEKTTEMTDYANEISAWGQEKYPIELDDTHKVHLIGLALEDVGVVPMVFYQTEVDIKSAEFKEDAMSVFEKFLKKYPYFRDAFKKITIRGTNVDPETATEQYDYESVVFDMK